MHIVPIQILFRISFQDQNIEWCKKAEKQSLSLFAVFIVFILILGRLGQKLQSWRLFLSLRHSFYHQDHSCLRLSCSRSRLIPLVWCFLTPVDLPAPTVCPAVECNSVLTLTPGVRADRTEWGLRSPRHPCFRHQLQVRCTGHPHCRLTSCRLGTSMTCLRVG